MCDHNHKTPKSSKQPHGSALEHGSAHERDHRQWSRRSFIKNLGIAGSMSMMLGKVPLTALAASPLGLALSNTEMDRILVLIRLKGGNDGLNTIIPLFDYGAYLNLRPGIGLPTNQIIGLNAEFGMVNTMQSLVPFWEEGRMKVVHNVGYPDQNLSHFRSADIWASASDAGVMDTSGWLGRYLDDQFPEYLTNPPEDPPAIQIGGTGNVLFNNEEDTNMAVIVSNPEELAAIAENGELYDPLDVPECYYGEQLTYLRTVANSTVRYAGVIAEAYDAAANAVSYQFSLGQQLAIVARLIKGGLQTRLYMVTLDGFDTHANQSNIHPALWFQLSEAVKAFYEDLGAGGLAHKVLSMTFSEFGRRPEQNASGGTDHGAAAPLLLFGEGLNGSGFVGSNPDLQNLDPVGNLPFDIDFRRIYATILEHWLCIDAGLVNQVMGQNFDRLGALGLDCLASGVNPAYQPAIRHRALYGSGEVIIEYTLPESMPIQVQIFDILGKPVATLFNGYQAAGIHRHVFQERSARLAAGIYVYNIKAGGRMYSSKIRLVR